MMDELYILEQLIKHKENDLHDSLSRGLANGNTSYHLVELIISMSRYVNDIRYCSKVECSCSPEHDIRFHYNRIKEYIQSTKGALFPIPYRGIEKIIEKRYV